MAQRVGRGIALLFHDRGTRRGCVVSSTLRPHFTPGKDPVPILQEAGWAPGPVWTSTTTSTTNTTTTTTNNNNNNNNSQIQALTSLYTSVLQPSQPQPTHYKHNLHTFSSISFSFLSVVGSWLLCTYPRFLPLWESQNVRRHCQNCIVLWLIKTCDIWRPETNFVGHRDRSLYIAQNRYE